MPQGAASPAKRSPDKNAPGPHLQAGCFVHVREPGVPEREFSCSQVPDFLMRYF